MKQRTFAVMAALAGAGAFFLAQGQQPPPAAVATPQPKSTKEADAIKKYQNPKNTPDETIAAVEALITNFADTSFKASALSAAAEASDRKGDWAKAIVYGDLSLEADPKGYFATDSLLLVAGELAQHTAKYDLDKETKLSKAEKDVNLALEIIPNFPKPPGVKISDADFATFKKDNTSEAHRDLGLIATARQKWDVAVTEFKLAVDGSSSPDSVMMARLGNAYNENMQYAEAKAILQKVLDMPNLNPNVKAFATQELTRATKGAK